MSAQVRQGYKQTELGVIPADWKVLPLRDLLTHGRLGGNYSNSEVEQSKPLVKMGNLARGYFQLEKIEYIPDRKNADPEHRLRFGDVLFNTRNTLDLVGKVAIWRAELPIAYYNSNLMRLEFDPNKLSSNMFANYILNENSSISRLRAIATGTTSVAAIYTRDLMQFVIPVPPHAEQQAIGEALSDMDALINGLNQLIAKKNDIKQAAMQQLLTGQLRLPGFSGEWEVKRTCELGEIVTGNTPSTTVAHYWGGDYPWITPTDISICRDMFESSRFITIEGLQSIRRLPANTVLVTCIASIGKNAILRVEGACNQQINAITPNKNNSSEFLYYVFEASKEYLLSNAGTTATSIISKATFSELTFCVPALKEQAAIATILSDMDGELATLEIRRNKARQLKQGMMQELLTGRVRFV